MYNGEHELSVDDNEYPTMTTIDIPDEPDRRPTDEKGRIVDADSMSDRELLLELVKVTRVLTDKAEEFIVDLPNNPMFKMFSKFMR